VHVLAWDIFQYTLKWFISSRDEKDMHKQFLMITAHYIFILKTYKINASNNEKLKL